MPANERAEKMIPAIEVFLHRARAQMRAFARSSRGNVAMMFAVALVPLIVATTAGLDYARAMLVRSQMTDALDAAALAVGSSGGNEAAATAIAQAYFKANYKGDMGTGGTGPTIKVNYNSAGSVTIAADMSMDTTVMKLAGQPSMDVTSSTTVVWGQSKLWVSLVLDNSGSMSQGDKNGSKMDALQSASKSLLGKLQAVSITPGDVQVGIVPFTRVINYKTDINGNSNSSANWIYWGFWEAAPANVKISDLDTANLTAGDTCPFIDKSQGFHCQKNSTNGASSTTTIPSGGLICPSMDSGSKNSDRSSEYYNGCYTSTSNGTTQVSSGKNASCGSATHCSCSTNNKNTVCTQTLYKHAWLPNSHSTWTGCFTDRAQSSSEPSGKVPDYDTENTAPGSDTTGFPATNASACLSTVTLPLNYGWTSLTNKITAMTPNGSTNQAIGVAHGWQMLTPGNPYGTPTVPANTARYMILFSDGLNTQDRWWGDGSTEGTSDDDNIDDRMSAACSAAKADGIVIYTLFVHIGTDGNSQPLEDCATDDSKYYDLTSTAQIQGAFDEIAQQITNVRVSR
jgi:Flp pilus assembly protein TadG